MRWRREAELRTRAGGPRKGKRVINGWRYAGLPWSYKLDKQAMYWDL